MSHLTPSVLAARQRARYYRDASGISELVIGAALVVFGSQDYLASKLAPFGHLGRVILVVVILILYGLLMLGNKRIVEWIKERLIYPRTGYVSTQDEADKGETARSPFPVILVLVLIIGVVSFASGYANYARWIWSAAMLLLFGSYVFLSGQFELDPRRSWLFLIPLVGGLAWWNFSKPSPPFMSLAVVVGASLAFASLIRLFTYLVRNPGPPSAAP